MAEVDGTPFGRYRLLEMLGRGGMGDVWRAYDIETKRTVAIKVLPTYLADDNEFVQRFRREAEAAAQLNSPHVVPIHNYGEIDGRLYVDMRLIEGRDLQTVLTEGPLGSARAVRIIEGVALALHAAHQVGLLHRDVKPSNILLDGNDFPYLIDFGIARAIDGTRMTKSGNTIGTFQYIAPERLDNRDEDARADIYSLACVLYECLVGDPPFPGDTMARLVSAHLNTPPPRPSITRADVPAQVDEVIATGMAKEPDQRYATTVELADAAHNAITTPIALPTQSLATRAAFVASPAVAMPPAKAAGAQPATSLNLETAQESLPDGLPPDTHLPTPPWWRRQQVRLALIAAIVILAAGAGAGITGYLLRPRPPVSHSLTAQAPPPPTSMTPPPPPPLGAEALEGLLLSPEQFAAATSPTPTPVSGGPHDEMLTATFSDPDCSGVLTLRDTHTYAGTGWTGHTAILSLDPPMN